MDSRVQNSVAVDGDDIEKHNYGMITSIYMISNWFGVSKERL